MCTVVSCWSCGGRAACGAAPPPARPGSLGMYKHVHCIFRENKPRRDTATRSAGVKRKPPGRERHAHQTRTQTDAEHSLAHKRVRIICVVIPYSAAAATQISAMQACSLGFVPAAAQSIRRRVESKGEPQVLHRSSSV